MVMTQATWDGSMLEEQEPELHVVAFYEDLRAGELAKEILDRIRSRVPRDTKTTPGLWRFDLLQNEHLQELGAADVADAVVIIVAARGTRALPNALLDCVANGIVKKRVPRVGLVAILDGSDEIANQALPAYRQLQALCRNAKLRFFSLPSRNLAPAPAVSDSFRLASGRFTDNFSQIEIHSYRGWGIND